MAKGEKVQMAKWEEVENWPGTPAGWAGPDDSSTFDDDERRVGEPGVGMGIVAACPDGLRMPRRELVGGRVHVCDELAGLLLRAGVGRELACGVLVPLRAALQRELDADVAGLVQQPELIAQAWAAHAHMARHGGARCAPGTPVHARVAELIALVEARVCPKGRPLQLRARISAALLSEEQRALLKARRWSRARVSGYLNRAAQGGAG
jgi:hypothetical protein